MKVLLRSVCYEQEMRQNIYSTSQEDNVNFVLNHVRIRRRNWNTESLVSGVQFSIYEGFPQLGYSKLGHEKNQKDSSDVSKFVSLLRSIIRYYSTFSFQWAGLGLECRTRCSACFRRLEHNSPNPWIYKQFHVASEKYVQNKNDKSRRCQFYNREPLFLLSIQKQQLEWQWLQRWSQRCAYFLRQRGGFTSLVRSNFWFAAFATSVSTGV